MPHCRKHNRWWNNDDDRDEQFGCPDCEYEEAWLNARAEERDGEGDAQCTDER